MDKEDIYLGDWNRIVLGDVPQIFLLEVVIRISLIYLILVVCVRLIGNRMSTDLSKIEMITRILLAAAIGMPLQAPDRGILPAAIVAVFAVISERVISYYAFKNQYFERITQDDLDLLVSESVLEMHNLRRAKITRERLFAQIRSRSICHLGEIRRLYMEANGTFTLVKYDEPQPGLSVIPDWDEDMRNEQSKADMEVCKKCGARKEDTQENGKCQRCQNTEWEKAVY